MAGRRGCLGLPLAFWLPGAYIAVAIYIWIDFTTINHDGLANIGLFLVTAPVTVVLLVIGSLMGRTSMPMPSGHGYLGDHALYYVPAVALIAMVLWLAGRAVDRAIARKGD